MKPPVALLLGLAALATGAVAVAQAEDALLKRYPYDPACAWGRIGNGKGMVVRCITEDEAKALRAAPASDAKQAAPSSGVSSGKAPSDAATPPSSAGDDSDADADSDAKEPDSDADSDADTAIEVTVGSFTPDEGNLSIGKLGAPKDRYAACVQKNGGLSAKTGEVSVRFLVRGRGIAEGVSVAKRSNMSKEAAQCVADVVDRRHTGTPSSPMVGATLVLKFSKGDKLTK